jgi:hypothetical protein
MVSDHTKRPSNDDKTRTYEMDRALAVTAKADKRAMANFMLMERLLIDNYRVVTNERYRPDAVGYSMMSGMNV